ncbi:MAG: stage II sporulation protein M [Flavobacteriales bacterium]
MKETTFIENNKEKWAEFEQLSENKTTDPDKLSDLFIELTEDLSYAKTFYPKRSVRVYLNYLAQKVFVSFHKQKRKFLATFVDFWHEKLPLEMYKGRKELLYGFLFFAIAVIIGAVSSHIDPEFSRVILGDNYVDMTIDNINRGDPMAVYKQMDEGAMFLQITINNIRVAFFAFILGIFFSVGSVFLLASNGIMLGAFQYFFYIKGLFLTSFLVIWIHGTFEISVIIIAGAAGIVLGNGLLFPKTLTRVQSLQISARRGMNMLLGTIPIFIAAGFLEGYVTRHTEMSDASKWSIILISLSIILGYFVIYPFVVARRTNFDGVVEEKPVHIENVVLKKHSIRDLGQIFYDTFRFYRQNFGSIAKVIFGINLPIIIVYLIYLYSTNPLGDYLLEESEVTGITLAFNTFEGIDWMGIAVNILLIAINIATVIHCASFIDKKQPDFYFKEWLKSIWPMLLNSFIITGFLYLFIFFTPAFISWLVIFLSPFIVLTFYPVISGEKTFLDGIKIGFAYGRKDWGLTLTSVLMIVGLAYLFTWIYHNPFIPDFDIKSFVLDEIVRWHTVTVFDSFMTIKNFISSLFVLLIFQLLIPLLIIAFTFQYWSVEDKQESISLRKRFEKFGRNNKMFEQP